jgi:hypothetical protein
MSDSGNGVDIAAVYQLLVQVAETVSGHTVILNGHSRILDEQSRILDEHTAKLNEHTSVLNDHTRILTDHTRVLNDHTWLLHGHSRKLDDLEHGQTSLRQATEYHSSVMGHGILISEFDRRVRRIEEHLSLPSLT